jgi:hypothetical protein
LETLSDTVIELAYAIADEIDRIDAQLFDMYVLYVTTMTYLIAFLLINVSVLAYILYKMKLRNDFLQEQITSVQRRIREELNPFIYS